MPDHNSLTNAMYALQKAFLIDVSNLTGYDTRKDFSTCNRVLGQGSRHGLLRFLEKHHLVLLEYARTSMVRSASVKHDNDGYPVFMNPLWRDLASEDVRISVTAFSLLRQATSLFRKWAEDEVPDDAGVSNFVARMGSQKVHCAQIVALVSEHIPKIIGNDDLTVCERTFPVITSGARAEKTPVLRRIDSVRYSPLNEQFRKDGFRVVSTKQPNRLVPVPKDWTKMRLVFAEPSDGMNLQQALRLWLEERAGSSKHLSFTSQDYQRRSLSYEGRSSIDLSDASDHLTSSVVWKCFRKHPVLRAALFSARSSRTIGPDGPVALTCFGTMGNATTFTVMSIVIAAAASAAEAHFRQYTGLRPRATTVFGDDVVCDSNIAGTMLEFLVGLGLVPNPRKTFIACAFRESCGLDLFREVDVTPVYVKRVAITRRDDLLRCAEQANAFHTRGLWSTAAALVALTGYRFAVGLGPGSLDTFSKGCLEYQPGAAWDGDYQRWVPRLLRGVQVKVKDRDSSLDLTYALFHGSRVRETAPSGAWRP